MMSVSTNGLRDLIAEVRRRGEVIRELRAAVVESEVAALSLTEGFAWTKRREREYRQAAESVTEQMLGVPPRCLVW